MALTEGNDEFFDWDEEYGCQEPKLVRFASRICRDPQLARDLVQECYVRALQHHHTLAQLHPAQRLAWYYRTVQNLAVDHFRRSHWIDLGESLERFDDRHAPGPLNSHEFESLLALVDPKQQVVLDLRFRLGMTSPEIARQLGIPEGTVRRRLQRALEKLRQYFNETI